MDRPVSHELRWITDYLAGELPPEQQAFLHQWLAEDERRQALLTHLASMRDAMSHDRNPRFDVARLVHEVEGRIHPVGTTQHPSRAIASPRPLPPASKRSSAVWRVAAGFCAATLVAIGVVSLKGRHAPSDVQRYQTAAGQRATIPLPNGATMILAPATKVAVTPNGIDVSGEAVFDVTASDPGKPFVVQTANVAVRVIGTRFAVRAYPDEGGSRVVVEQGKVSIHRLRHDDRAPTVLSARMIAQVTDSGIEIRRGVDVREYTAWTEGRLVFDAAPFRDVIRELARAYGAEIRVADSALARSPMTLTTSVNDVPLPELLQQLTFSIDAHVVRDGAAFVVVPGRAIPRVPAVKRVLQPENSGYGK